MTQIFDEDQQHIDPTTDTLLVGGKVYIGVVGLDPVANPTPIYDNRELTGSALAHPQIIGSDGRVPTKMWVSGKYSLKIDDSADAQKYLELQNGYDTAVGNVQTSGSIGVNDIVATGSPTQIAYIDNTTYIVTAPEDNTGPMTINIDTIGIKSIRKGHDQLLAAGDIKASMRIVLVYNISDDWMELQSGVLGGIFPSGIDVTGAVGIDGDILDSNANEIISLTPIASAVNDISVTNAATGDSPVISAVGDDTNINLNLSGKGTGNPFVISGGLRFPTTQIASPVTTTLDDYQEGTKAIAVSCGTSGTVTLNFNNNIYSYTKIGRLVFIQGAILVDSVSSPLGTLSITNFEHTSQSGDETSDYAAITMNVSSVASPLGGGVTGVIGPSSTGLIILPNDTSQSSSDVAATMQAGTLIYFSGCYTTE